MNNTEAFDQCLTLQPTIKVHFFIILSRLCIVVFKSCRLDIIINDHKWLIIICSCLSTFHECAQHLFLPLVFFFHISLRFWSIFLLVSHVFILRSFFFIVKARVKSSFGKSLLRFSFWKHFISLLHFYLSQNYRLTTMFS